LIYCVVRRTVHPMLYHLLPFFSAYFFYTDSTR
jgi:hypothetical protein